MTPIIDNFTPRGGHHCITNSLVQMFEFYRFPLTEEMLFGLGRGLGFIYLNLKSSPFISGRIKPIEFEKNIGDALNISIRCRQSKNPELSQLKLIKKLQDGHPVMIYVDMAYLPYLNLGETNHFGGHSVVVCGYDMKNQVFQVSDRDHSDRKIHTPKGKIGRDYHPVPADALKTARNSRFKPFPAANKTLEFDFTDAADIDSDIIRKAIQDTADSMLHSPAPLMGISGIHKFAREIKKWRRFDAATLKLAGITNYFMIHADGGTGGGAFRRMYGDFLIESANTIRRTRLADVGNGFKQVAQYWDQVAFGLKSLYETGNTGLLEEASDTITQIADTETDLFLKLLAIF